MLSYLKSLIRNRTLVGIVLFLALYIAARMIYYYIYTRHGSFGPAGIIGFLTHLEAKITYGFISIFGLTKKVDGVLVYFTSGMIMRVEPGCSGFGEMFKALIIFIFYPGPWKKKLWFLPSTVLFIFFAALIHLALLGLVLALDPPLYEFAHSWITRIIFYGMFFLMWIAWEERIRGKQNIAME
jgi:exosortase/archaeosortase family protein